MAESKTALVTGAGSGIGQAAALALQAAGYGVVLAGRRLERLEATAARKAAEGGAMLPVAADVTDPGSVEALFARAEEEFGRLDVLFNNAGLDVDAKPLDELPVEDWKLVVDTNLNGAFLCARQAIRLMKRQDPQGGRIINNGSISAHVPRPFTGAYTASKHAITGLTRSISLDGRPYDIACSQIDIGNAASEMWDGKEAHMPQANGELASEPIMDVQHVASAVVYMASLPLDANVQFMTVMATKMPYIGRG